MKKKWTKFWKPLLFVAFLITMTGNLLYAQKIQVTGKVTNEATGEEIPGVSIVVKGTTTGTITDFDGLYKLSVPGDATLVFSFIGMENQEVAVENRTTVNVDLKESTIGLEEVVAIGYGVQKKKELTGAVSSVKSDDMVKIVGSDFTKALQGQVAGVSVVESSGRPGDQANVQIRGLGSLNGEAGPLYVVDGIPYDSNPNIASEDIESVDILKDGAAAAVYGTRASNGVILITTKRGKAGETKVSVASYYGIQNITSGTELLNTPEHIYVNEMMHQAKGNHSPILYFNPDALDYNSDFVGAVTNDNAAIQNHNLTISGGKENLTFNLNANYFGQDGILIQSGYERFSTRANTTFKKGNFEAFASISISKSIKDQEPWGLYEFAQFQGPYRKPLNTLETVGNTVTISGNNPDHVSYLSRLLTQEDERKEDSYNLSANLKYEILDGLKVQVNLGSNYWTQKREFWQPQYLVYNEDGVLNELGSVKQATLTRDLLSSNKYTIESVLSYSKTFGSHSLSALAGYTREQTRKDNLWLQKKDFISNDIQVFQGASDMTNLDGTKLTNGLIGKLFRVQYSYDGKYLFSASVRHDGSSKFGSENRYGTFPGVSAGWNISEENFMQNLDMIDNLKIRASYAEVGNEGIPPYLYSPYIDANIDYVWGPESGDELVGGAIQRGFANEDIGWETNVTKNIGVDLLMYDGKFSFTMDMYNNSKKDMLLDVRVPASTGTTVPDDWANKYNSRTINIGNMTNKGIEIAAYYKNRTSYGLGYQITGTFTKNVNEITDLAGLDRIPNSDSKPGSWRAAQQDVTTYMVPGYEAGAFFLIPTDGIIKTDEELTEVKKYMPNAEKGDLRYVDVNDDGQINDADRVYQGSGMPDFETSLILSANYKGFDLSTQIFYSHGNEVFNGSKLFAYSMGRHKDLYYMWTPQNSTSDIMSLRNNSEHDNFRSRSDYFLEDGTYLRIRNITLGYTLPKKLLGNVMDNCRFYFTAQNPFTLTNYEGYDPEIGGNGVTTRGIDKGNYPVTRKFLMGVQIDF